MEDCPHVHSILSGLLHPFLSQSSPREALFVNLEPVAIDYLPWFNYCRPKKEDTTMANPEQVDSSHGQVEFKNDRVRELTRKTTCP